MRGSSGHAAEVGESASTEAIEDRSAIWSGEQGQGENRAKSYEGVRGISPVLEHMQYAFRSYQ